MIKLSFDSCLLPILTFQTFRTRLTWGRSYRSVRRGRSCCSRCGLETRFFPQADGSSELRVRVYPDKVHIDSHEPELTADELTWGQHFWEQTWRAANDEERAQSGLAAVGRSFRSAARRVGRPRAQTAESRRPPAPIAPISRSTSPRAFRLRRRSRVVDARAGHARVAEPMDRARLQERAAGRERQGWSDPGPTGDRPRPIRHRLVRRSTGH